MSNNIQILIAFKFQTNKMNLNSIFIRNTYLRMLIRIYLNKPNGLGNALETN